MTKTTSFQTEIRPFFTEQDIRGMSKAFNLGSYDDVKKHAGAIYDRIRGIGGAVMPPPPPKGEGAWPQSRIELLIAAWEAGSDFVKVFPCTQVGGDTYIRALKTALPQIPLIAAGGVNQHTAGKFILAGATAIGVGTELIPPEAIEQRESERIRELAQRFAGFVKDARHRLAPQKPSPVAPAEDFWKRHKHSPHT
jgi:hypothetical protein